MSLKPKKASYGFLRNSFMVRRYHTVAHVHKEETVGHHTANVLGILFHLYDDHPPLYLIRHVLHHDAMELATGDVPATSKWAFPDLAAALKKAEAEVAERQGLTIHILTPEEEAIVKFADVMDLCFKSVEELAAGNDVFSHVLANGMSVVRALLENALKNHQQAHTMYAILKSNKYVQIEAFDAPTLSEFGITAH